MSPIKSGRGYLDAKSVVRALYSLVLINTEEENDPGVRLSLSISYGGIHSVREMVK